MNYLKTCVLSIVVSKIKYTGNLIPVKSFDTCCLNDYPKLPLGQTETDFHILGTGPVTENEMK